MHVEDCAIGMRGEKEHMSIYRNSEPVGLPAS